MTHIIRKYYHISLWDGESSSIYGYVINMHPAKFLSHMRAKYRITTIVSFQEISKEDFDVFEEVFNKNTTT